MAQELKDASVGRIRNNMATSQDYIEYVCEQLRDTGVVRYKKMFGEYMVYVDDKPMLTVCDNTAYVKQLPCIEELMKEASCGFPYKGAKEHYILDVDNASLCIEVIRLIEPFIKVPKPRKKKVV